MEAAEVPFQAVEVPFDEAEMKRQLAEADAPSLAAALAEGKALSVAAGPEDLVLGSDQTLERDDGSILHKAGSREELAEQLRSLRGSMHRLHSAAVVAERGQVVWRATDTVTLRMRGFSEELLSDYLDRHYEEVRWSVGGYHVEAAGVQLFERIEGSHFAVLGLPLLPLLDFLRSRGVVRS